MRNIKRFSILSFTLLSVLLVFSLSSCGAGVTQSNAYPEDDATSVWVNIPEITILINESEGQTMNGTIILVATGDTLTIDTQSNSTQTLTISGENLPLEASTTYQWWANVSNETNVWSNTSYNFTTGTPSRLSEYTSFDANELLVVSIVVMVIAISIILFIIDIMNSKKLEVEKLIYLILIIVFMTVVLAFI